MVFGILHAIDAAGTPSILDIDVLASGPSQLIELLAKGFVVNRLIAFALGIQHADEPKPCPLRPALRCQRCQPRTARISLKERHAEPIFKRSNPTVHS
jgi:hypothetical protein